MQVLHDINSDDLLGDFSHMNLAEGCFWLSVTNLVTIGYGSIVSHHAFNSIALSSDEVRR